MIQPTIGRVVWFYQSAPATSDVQPEAAMVTYVHSDRMVNLVVFGPYGQPRGVTSVALVQPEDDNKTPFGPYCAWMPYQTAQAARHEAGKGSTGPEPIVSSM
jgi:hypothetical protein